MKKVPKVFRNEINKTINNNKRMCYVEDENSEVHNKEVLDTLSHVYAGLGRKYNTKVLIETKTNVYDTTLIAKNKEELITQENAVIKVKDIRKITIKK